MEKFIILLDYFSEVFRKVDDTRKSILSFNQKSEVKDESSKVMKKAQLIHTNIERILIQQLTKGLISPELYIEAINKLKT